MGLPNDKTTQRTATNIMQKIGKKNHQNFKILMTFQYGAPGEIRTPDPLVRSQVLYPTELRVHVLSRLFAIVLMVGYYTR